MSQDSKFFDAPYDNGHTTGEDILKYPGTLKADQGIVKRYSVMGKVTATGELLLLDKNAIDGSEVPFCVTTNEADIDTAGEAKVVDTAIRGSFNDSTLIFAAGTVVADVWDDMRALSLYALPVEEIEHYE